MPHVESDAVIADIIYGFFALDQAADFDARLLALGIVQAWIASGIFLAFSNGNAGPSCNSSSSPGDYALSYSAGAFDINNFIAWFSSRGDPNGGEIKPNIAAPGVDVRSSVPGNGYDVNSGTSMASPHVAGTVALMWSAAPSIIGDIAATRALLDQTAIDTSDLSCGGSAADNNVWGEGRLDAYAAVDQAPRGPVGALQGTVVRPTEADPFTSPPWRNGPGYRTNQQNDLDRRSRSICFPVPARRDVRYAREPLRWKWRSL